MLYRWPPALAMNWVILQIKLPEFWVNLHSKPCTWLDGFHPEWYHSKFCVRLQDFNALGNLSMMAHATRNLSTSIRGHWMHMPCSNRDVWSEICYRSTSIFSCWCPYIHAAAPQLATEILLPLRTSSLAWRNPKRRLEAKKSHKTWWSQRAPSLCCCWSWFLAWPSPIHGPKRDRSCPDAFRSIQTTLSRVLVTHHEGMN